jgi:hypothetical protein
MQGVRVQSAAAAESDPAHVLLRPGPTVPPTPESAAAHGLRISLTLPVLATSNAAGPVGDAIGSSGQADVHVAPELLMRWTRQFQDVRLTATLDANSDQFLRTRSENGEQIFGSLKLAWTDGRSDRFVPYLAYTGTLDFSTVFARRDDTLHDFTAGFTSGFGLSAAGSVIPFRDADRPGDWSLSLDSRSAAGWRTPTNTASLSPSRAQISSIP